MERSTAVSRFMKPVSPPTMETRLSRRVSPHPPALAPAGARGTRIAAGAYVHATGTCEIHAWGGGIHFARRGDWIPAIRAEKAGFPPRVGNKITPSIERLARNQPSLLSVA
jgi:hypothetical protein